MPLDITRCRPAKPGEKSSANLQFRRNNSNELSASPTTKTFKLNHLWLLLLALKWRTTLMWVLQRNFTSLVQAFPLVYTSLQSMACDPMSESDHIIMANGETQWSRYSMNLNRSIHIFHLDHFETVHFTGARGTIV